MIGINMSGQLIIEHENLIVTLPLIVDTLRDNII